MPHCKADNVLETPQSQPRIEVSHRRGSFLPPCSVLVPTGSSRDSHWRSRAGAQCQVYLPDTPEPMPCKTKSPREVPASRRLPQLCHQAVVDSWDKGACPAWGQQVGRPLHPTGTVVFASSSGLVRWHFFLLFPFALGRCCSLAV